MPRTDSASLAAEEDVAGAPAKGRELDSSVRFCRRQSMKSAAETGVSRAPCAPGSTVRTATRRSGSGNGSGRSSSASTTVKAVTVAPMPTASVRIAVAANDRLRPQDPRAMACVAPDLLERRPAPDLARVLARQRHVAERAAAGVDGVGRRHPRLLETFLRHAAMELELLGELGVAPAAVQPVANATKQGAA